MARHTLIDHLRAGLLPGALTLALLGLLFWGYQFATEESAPPSPGEHAPSSSRASPTPGGPLDTLLRIPSANLDSDQDGLQDAIEYLYRTDIYRGDTDGDGYLDGAEVANGYDPTIPSPNDKLAARASPLPPLPSPLPTPSSLTYTQQFFSETGLAPSRESLLANEEILNDFIDDTNAEGFLPEITEEDLRVTDASGGEAITTYLDAISIPQNPKLKPVDTAEISAAFTALTVDKNPGPLNTVIANLKTNVDVLKEVKVPKEAVDLHTTYLAASIALWENTEKLKGYQTDYVGALVAASRIERLRPVFQDVANDIQALEKKYTIT